MFTKEQKLPKGWWSLGHERNKGSHPGSPSTGPTEKGLIFGCYFFQKLCLPLTGSYWGAKKDSITSFTREHVACSSKGKIMPPHLVSCIFTSEWMGKCVSIHIFLTEKNEPLLVPSSIDIFWAYLLMPTALKEPAAYSHDFPIIQKIFSCS